MTRVAGRHTHPKPRARIGGDGGMGIDPKACRGFEGLSGGRGAAGEMQGSSRGRSADKEGGCHPPLANC